MSRPPSVLVVLDGFGYSQQTYGNAIYEAKTPTLDLLWSQYPSYLLKAAEEEVGLEFGEIGNSEVGHITIGTGRVIPQSLNRINKAIEDGSFRQNQALLSTINHVRSHNSNLHLLGIVSTAGVHGHLYHYLEVLKLAAEQGIKRIFLHLILDGRDSGKYDSPLFIKEIDKVRSRLGVGTYASMIGRLYTMDRNQNWEKIEVGHKLLFGQASQTYPDPISGLNAYYANNLDDENVPPTLITNSDPIKIEANDAVIFTNFREDRARQITEALISPEFSKYQRPPIPKNFKMTTMTEYKKGLPVDVAFTPPSVANTLSDVISSQSLSQIHIAETEKYAHVTYFFNGGREEKTFLEEYFLIPSLTPEHFESQPQMSAPQITQAIIQAIDLGYDMIISNYANCDMVGHTGNYQATIRAVETIDQEIEKLRKYIFSLNGTLYITADHGNAEQMINSKTGEVYKKHTIAPVPFIIANSELFSDSSTQKIMTTNTQISGLLSDVAPTVLKLMQLPIPFEMTGTSLLG